MISLSSEDGSKYLSQDINFLKKGGRVLGKSRPRRAEGSSTAVLRPSVPVLPSVTNVHVAKYSTCSGEEHAKS